MVLSFSRKGFFLLKQAARIGADHFNPIRSWIEFSFVRPACSILVCPYFWYLYFRFLAWNPGYLLALDSTFCLPDTMRLQALLLICLAPKHHFLLGSSAYGQVIQVQMPIWIPGSLLCVPFFSKALARQACCSGIPKPQDFFCFPFPEGLLKTLTQWALGLHPALQIIKCFQGRQQRMLDSSQCISPLSWILVPQVLDVLVAFWCLWIPPFIFNSAFLNLLHKSVGLHELFHPGVEVWTETISLKMRRRAQWGWGKHVSVFSSLGHWKRAQAFIVASQEDVACWM